MRTSLSSIFWLSAHYKSSDLFLSVSDYVIHPAVLDSCLHAIVHPAFTGNADKGVYYLPSRIGAVVLPGRLHCGLPETLYAHVVFKEWLPGKSLSYISSKHNSAFTLSQMRLYLTWL